MVLFGWFPFSAGGVGAGAEDFVSPRISPLGVAIKVGEGVDLGVILRVGVEVGQEITEDGVGVGEKLLSDNSITGLTS